jgi:hypothetical protein
MTRSFPVGTRKPGRVPIMGLGEVVDAERATLPPGDHLDMAENYLQLAARHIDTAGDLGGTEQTDMLACFASNVLQGSLALIRELRRALASEQRTRGKRP